MSGEAESLVERVGRAIEAEMFRVQELSTERGIITPERLARAAIAAMREPTVAMKFAGHTPMEIGVGKTVHDPEVLPNIWRVMIDCALRESA